MGKRGVQGTTENQLPFVRVRGRYRVGNLLGSGGSGEPNCPTLTQV